jgi:histidine ammonia-lyase
MGTTAARKCAMILDNSRKVLAIELFTAAQALWLRGEEKLSPATKAVYDCIRTYVAPIEEDVVMYPNMNACENLIRRNAITAAAESVCGALR